MTLVQKKIYLLRLFESNLTSTTPNSKEEKRILERQVIRHLSTEQQLYIQNRKEKELLTMGEKIQSALNRIQNPDNCSNSRILVCKVKPFLPIPLYAEPGQPDRIVFLDRRWDMCRVMKKELPHAPEVAPSEIKDFLLENHPNPPLWFLGQEWVDFWYDVMVGPKQSLDNDQLVNSNCTNKRKLFIATDEPNSVLEEANRKWGNKYKIYHGKQDLQCKR
ncbi:unnamed protein product [Meloidogyne enterolobii]|uniref:Uncharacterized protein n=1 Tax=Meloidogyne enterolobii TaxID=390850 RepID=A0ACB0YIT5_MELEN